MTGEREQQGVLVQARGLSKRFKLYERPRDRLMEWLSLGSVTRHEVFWALEDVDVEIRSGECLGVIGRNGSGKSTLLKLLSGALLPTRGEVDVHGRVYALLELGTGFNKQLTGRQNIAHAGAMLGIPSAYIRAREAQIIAFADLGGFIDVPVRSYSSGMMSRLAFSLFAFLDPDVLMIDEVLSVGDEAFKARCFELIGERVAQGRSVVFVSHALRTMTRLCDRVVWLEDGRVVDIGDPTAMVNAFVDRHRTSGAAPERATGSGASRTAQPSTPAADVIVPERSAEPGGADPAEISCVFVADPDQPPHSGVRVEKVWLESPLGDLRESAPAGLSFVIAARVQGAENTDVALEIEVLSPSGAVLGGSRVAAPDGGGVLRLLCNAGLGPGVHGVRVRARVGGTAGADEDTKVLVERAAVPVVGTAPTSEGLVLFRRVTLHDCAGD